MNHVNGWLILFIFLTGCATNVPIVPAVQTVLVPLPAQDERPRIHWDVSILQRPSGSNYYLYPGYVDTDDIYTEHAKVFVTEGARIVLRGRASNPGGVKQFHVKVQQGNRTLWDVTTTGAPDPNGLVPSELSISGTNGAGAAGSRPMEVTILKSSPVILTSTATNFNGWIRAITITYQPTEKKMKWYDFF